MFIETIQAREVLDSRGNPTVHVAVVLADGAKPPPDAKQFEGRYYLDEPKPIARYLAATYGGAGPHP